MLDIKVVNVIKHSYDDWTAMLEVELHTLMNDQWKISQVTSSPEDITLILIKNNYRKSNA